mmetsp:Transcript_25340/g.42087  ORF Transcript_25340/g.42087 Transcript_25340/m.42087 type:complete len:307 (-) Transcript_25340:1207-2127(-)
MSQQEASLKVEGSPSLTGRPDMPQSKSINHPTTFPSTISHQPSTMSLNLVSVTKGIHPCEKYDKIKTIAADDLTALSLVRLKDPPQGMTAAHNCFAMKYVNTNGSGEDIDIAIDEIRNEIDKYLSLKPHPNIVRVYDIFETSTNIFIVMEFCTGGNIIVREGTSSLFKPKSEHETAQIIGKLLSAVRFLHDHHIIHGEIRPENICYETADADAEIKIVDLGMSRHDTNKARGEIMNYAKNYAAALETYEGQYLAAGDVWSVGVIAFILLSGEFPFAREYVNKRFVIVALRVFVMSGCCCCLDYPRF